MFHSRRGRLAVLLGICLASAIPMAAAASTEDNNHGAAYLRVGVGARALGMGSAQVAASDDAMSVYWNPANLTRLTGLSIGAMITAGLEAQRRHNFFAAAYPFEFATLGIGWVNAGTKDVEKRDINRQLLGSFDQGDNAVLVSIAAGWNSLSVGATGKIVNSDIGTSGSEAGLEIGDDSVTGFGLDLGTNVEITPYFRAAATVQDLGTKLGDQGKQSEVPANLRLGLAAEPVDDFTIAFDTEKTRDNEDWKFRFGGEYRAWFGDENDYSGAARMGVNDGRFAGGVGFGVKYFMFDYAYVVEPEDFLNENHRFSLSLNFGERGLRDEDEAVIVPTQVIHDTVTIVREVPAPETAGGGMEEHFWFPPAHVNFKFDTAEISGADPIPVLDDVARILTENPRVTIEIQGHTDWIGSDEYNQGLSERRAEAIRDYLIKKGIDGSRMTTRGFGESQPIDTNETDLGRARNRRIEFLVTNH
jgi:outer membrane protein OmpA-like peptidoglycan-associated protein